MCFACRSIARRLGVFLAPVFPVRLCPLPSPLYAVLMGYKEAPVREARDRFAPMVRMLVSQYAAAHAPCLAAAAGGALDAVLPVPSTARPSGAPLAGVEGLDRAACAHVLATWVPGALIRAAAPVGHMRPDAGAFTVPSSLRHLIDGRRVLLLDDTYVSGARSQSAAAALRRAGARAVVIVALGRVLRPDRSARHADFLARHRRTAPIEPLEAGGPVEPCCRCVQTPALTE